MKTIIRRSRVVPWMAMIAPLAIYTGSVLAQSQIAGDDSIVATYSHPSEDSLPCAEAAQRSTVSFEFRRMPFQITQVSLYVDGRGLAPDAVAEDWPRVTLTRGLHAGRNLVEVVATGQSRQSMQRRLTVLVGAEANDDDVSPVEISCLREYAAAPDLVATSTPLIVEAPVEYVQQPPQTVFVDDPMYIYHPMPVYPIYPGVIPFISIVYTSSPPVYYYPRPYCPPPPVVYPSTPPPHYGAGAYVPGAPHSGQTPRPPPHTWQPPGSATAVRTPPHDPGMRVNGFGTGNPTTQWNTPSQNTVHYQSYPPSYPQPQPHPTPQSRGFSEPTHSMTVHNGLQNVPQPVGPPPMVHYVPSAPMQQTPMPQRMPPPGRVVSRPPPRSDDRNGAVVR